MKIIDAAKQLDIPYENAKAIYRTYKIEGRFSKKLQKKREKSIENVVKKIVKMTAIVK